MSDKRNLFDSDSDEDGGTVDFAINKNYAQRYEEWREAEIKRKLEDQYGNADQSLSSSSSDDDDDDPEELKKVLSKDFFEVISSLKTKDPKIYNPEVQFFKSEKEGLDPLERKKKIKQEREKPVFLRDYERKLIVERGGQLSDDDSDMEGKAKAVRPQSPSYAEEQRQLKESLQNAVLNSDDSDEDSGLLVKKEKSKAEKAKEEEDYVAWLRGEKEDINDSKTKEALKPLQKLWTDPKLDEGEKFLRDYVLNKRFLEKDDEPIDEGNLTDEDYQEEYLSNFERKFNFRFEEPDRDFLKRYPRTLEHSMRKKDTRRAQHRDAVKKRKEEEKQRRKEELKVLKALKRKEILQKIQKIKEITGNDQLGLEPEELEEDFDPEAHDRRMKEMFSDEYYQGAEDEEELDELHLPPLEEELLDDYENWDEWDGTDKNGNLEGGEEGEIQRAEPDENNYEPHCDDPDFNMDCDYDPSAERLSTRRISAREKRKLKRQSRFGRLVNREKPVFDPNDKTFQEYVDEYYGMDYEDLIGDLPCRFKYKKVPANDFGLTIEEILAADDKELNQWASIKKTYTLRPEHVEKYEQKVYQQKARDVALKKKLLPSLFKHENESGDQPSKKKKKKHKKVQSDCYEEGNVEVDHETPADDQVTSLSIEDSVSGNHDNVKEKKKKNKSKLKPSDVSGQDPAQFEDAHKVLEGMEGNSDSAGVDFRLSTERKRKKKKPLNAPVLASSVEEGVIKGARNEIESTKQGEENSSEDVIQTKKKRKKERDQRQNDPNGSLQEMEESTPVKKRKKVGVKGKNHHYFGQHEIESSPSDSTQASKKSEGSNVQTRRNGADIQQANSGSSKKKFMNNSGGTKKHGEKKRKNFGLGNHNQKKNRIQEKSDLQSDLSDARLKAYGLHPKKFKNKLKYGNVNKTV